MNTYIGIDPGAKGAICALNPRTGYIQFFDLSHPAKDIFDWLFAFDPQMIERIIIEDVHSRFGMSAKSNFSFGWNVSMPHIIFDCLGYTLEKVTPKIWQAELGIAVVKDIKGPARQKAIKQAGAKTCEQLYKGCDIYGPKGGLKDGRSDSLCIAIYAHLTHKKKS